MPTTVSCICRQFPRYIKVEKIETLRMTGRVEAFRVTTSHKLNKQFVEALFKGWKVVSVEGRVCVIKAS